MTTMVTWGMECIERKLLLPSSGKKFLLFFFFFFGLVRGREKQYSCYLEQHLFVIGAVLFFFFLFCFVVVVVVVLPST